MSFCLRKVEEAFGLSCCMGVWEGRHLFPSHLEESSLVQQGCVGQGQPYLDRENNSRLGRPGSQVGQEPASLCSRSHKKTSPSPDPWGPCPLESWAINGTGIIAYIQPTPTHSGVSPLTPQLQESEGLSARPSQRVDRAFTTMPTKADMGTVGVRNRLSVLTLLSFLMLLD